MYADYNPLEYASRIEAMNENYTHLTIEQIKNAPKRWLASLPMFEYAYLLVVHTALRTGGDPDQYIEVLFKKKIKPILSKYQDKLMEYRYHMALLKQNYDSLREKINNLSQQKELEKLKCFTAKTRRDIRRVCFKYECDHRTNFVTN